MSYKYRLFTCALILSLISAGTISVTNPTVNASHHHIKVVHLNFPHKHHMKYHLYYGHHSHHNHYYKDMPLNQLATVRLNDYYNDIASNTRDLGGYPALNHKYSVRHDRLIRSDNLSHINNSGIEELQRLHVNRIIDLRNSFGGSSINHHPDKGENPYDVKHSRLEGTNIKFSHAAIYSSREHHEMKHHLHKHGIYYFYGKTAVMNPHAKRAYRKVFRIALHNHHGAILFHCTAGHDRTGTTSALLLSALGVNRKYIIDDYLLTNYYSSNPKPMNKQRRQINHFFNVIDNNYGSVMNYLHEGLGLNDNQIAELRSEYLVRN